MAENQEAILLKIKEQGELVRKLKAAKESSEKVRCTINVLSICSYHIYKIVLILHHTLKLMRIRLYCRLTRTMCNTIYQKLINILVNTVTFVGLIPVIVI